MRSALSKYFFFSREEERPTATAERAELNHLPVTKTSDALALVRSFEALRKTNAPQNSPRSSAFPLIIRLADSSHLPLKGTFVQPLLPHEQCIKPYFRSPHLSSLRLHKDDFRCSAGRFRISQPLTKSNVNCPQVCNRQPRHESTNSVRVCCPSNLLLKYAHAPPLPPPPPFRPSNLKRAPAFRPHPIL